MPLRLGLRGRRHSGLPDCRAEARRRPDDWRGHGRDGGDARQLQVSRLPWLVHTTLLLRCGPGSGSLRCFGDADEGWPRARDPTGVEWCAVCLLRLRLGPFAAGHLDRPRRQSRVDLPGDAGAPLTVPPARRPRDWQWLGRMSASGHGALSERIPRHSRPGPRGRGKGNGAWHGRRRCVGSRCTSNSVLPACRLLRVAPGLFPPGRRAASIQSANDATARVRYALFVPWVTPGTTPWAGWDDGNATAVSRLDKAGFLLVASIPPPLSYQSFRSL